MKQLMALVVLFIAAVSTKGGQPQEHWSFRVIRRPVVPRVKHAHWARGAIDRFVQARLDEAGLLPVADADRRTLIRRAYYDLIGLPSAPEEIDAFVTDSRSDALPHLIDRLLASPRFGERWGRHWLDVARFAESTGGGRTRILENAWRYRDYVIEAFNRDKPFDQFLIEQIAGDLLPHDNDRRRAEQLTATSFLVLGPHNYELQDKELLRMEVVDEQLETVGRAFLGLAIGCARCHDHKFDPITMRDYYALAGIFRSTKTLIPGNVSGFVQRELPAVAQRRAAIDAHAAKVKPIEEQIATAQGELKEVQGALGDRGAKIDRSRWAGVVLDDTQAEVTGEWQNSTSVPRYLDKGYLHDKNAGKGEKSVNYVPDLPAAGVYEVRISFAAAANRAANTPVRIVHAGGEETVVVDQTRRPSLRGAFEPLGRFRFEAGKSGSVTIGNQGTTAHVIADAVAFVPAGAADPPATELPDRQRAELAARESELQGEIKNLQGELARLMKQAPLGPPLVMSVLEEKQIEDCPLLIRGNVHNAGDPVPRGFIKELAGADAPSIDPDTSGRRELGQWLTRRENPLTARVIVNRVWHHLFGRGLVRTVDNFGTTGELPSQPELIDWLAVEFVEDGWSVKRLIRRIMLSRVYQLRSVEGPGADDPHYTRQAWEAGWRRDPENRLLWRQNRRRLEAEALRDAILAVSGRLDLTSGGAVIPATATSEFGYDFTSRRRSVYVPAFRNTLHPIFAFFDFAEPNLVTGRRNTSTLPTQALYLMNDPWIMDQSQHAAQRLLDAQNLDAGKRIDLLYRRALGRLPTESERALALAFVGTSDPDQQTWAQLCQALFACIDFRYVE